MTDLTITRGDSRNYEVTITESDLVTPVDITSGIIRFAVKKRFDQLNSDATIFKTTYDPAEVQITDGPNGVSLVQVFAGDTQNARPGEYIWDLDLTRREALLTNVGTISVSSGGAVMTGTGLDLTNVLPGDVIAPAGGTPSNQKDLVITSVGGDGTSLDPGAGNLVSDYTGWSLEAGISIQIFRGDRKTPTGLSGAYTLIKDVAT
jgi:hypothetical protein